MVKVLGLGDNVCDVYLHTGTMYPGGQALNFTVYASQLGAQADYMGVFGRDAVADHIQSVLDAKGVGRSHCRQYPGENGFARVTLVDGDRVFKGSNRGRCPPGAPNLSGRGRPDLCGRLPAGPYHQ